jgi:hypothetical protein
MDRLLDKNGCQKFSGMHTLPSVVMLKLKAWEPVKKGHCLAKFCSTGAAVLECSDCQREFSAVNYAGS